MSEIDSMVQRVLDWNKKKTLMRAASQWSGNGKCTESTKYPRSLSNCASAVHRPSFSPLPKERLIKRGGGFPRVSK